MGQIYKITNILNGLVYIGQTKRTAQDRYKEHIHTYKNTKFYNSIHKYGPENFKLEIIRDNVPNEQLDKLERYYIKKYDSYHNGYNETLGGNGTINYIFTDADKEKKRQSMKKAWQQKGTLLTSKTRNKKISQANKGKVKSIEHRQKLSIIATQRIGTKNPFFGKHHTKKSCEKISKQNSKRVYMYTKDLKYIKSFKNGKITAIYLKVLLSLNFKEESIYRGINWACIKNKLYKNYYFKYYKV